MEATIELPNGNVLKRSINVFYSFEVNDEIDPEIEQQQKIPIRTQQVKKSKHKNHLQRVPEHRPEGCPK
ncbi:hypothetical protein LOAG_19095 [Loa loa]|uniref:Uncharacterized protein n=1 Tax=Loa loa TaxID=7209 RepID=A0A1S0UDI3_LOALO|nr:hypothetical protein LOAG_19095 [Loa loa]EJD73486.1 hypothetical protein LOAG_19095 [Loa loa]